ncbi:MAG: polysaccharide deacetylase family protein [Bacteroidia bacterium]
MYYQNTPSFIRNIYHSLEWKINTKEKVIYLTFDDGPHPEITNWVLQELKKYKATATFFCVGENVKKYPDIYDSILKDGHVTGNHTYNHLNGWFTSSIDYAKNVKTCAHLVKSNLFRPPYGKLTRTQIKHLNKYYRIIMWDVLSCDFDVKTDKKKALSQLLKGSNNGSIVVFHDSEKAKEKLQYMLPVYLNYFIKKNYTFKSIPT